MVALNIAAPLLPISIGLRAEVETRPVLKRPVPRALIFQIKNIISVYSYKSSRIFMMEWRTMLSRVCHGISSCELPILRTRGRLSQVKIWSRHRSYITDSPLLCICRRSCLRSLSRQGWVRMKLIIEIRFANLLIG